VTAGAGRGRAGGPAACRSPGPLDDPGLASDPGPGSPGVSTHPADSPAVPEPSSSPGGIRVSRPKLPLTPCAVTRDQLHLQGDGPRVIFLMVVDSAARATDEDANAATIKEDPVGGRSGWGAFPQIRLVKAFTTRFRGDVAAGTAAARATSLSAADEDACAEPRQACP
jgi:hypothetical protein